MSRYGKLSISDGGGIIFRDQQADQNACATIAIGLGGTGIACLRTLKKEIFTRVKPDADPSSTTAYRHIRFIAVDTDVSSLGSTGAADSIDINTEFCDISSTNIEGLLRRHQTLRQRPYLKWLKADQIHILSTEAGAGGVRQIGRLLLMQNCAAFVEKLRGAVTSAKIGLMDDANINIHIFTGMAGGTGAGTFLDVCYLVQYVLEQLGWDGVAYTCGYFFLPDININHAYKDYLASNGFASMKELDWCMNFANNGGEWNQAYDGFSIRTSAPPVKLAHLICATDTNGRLRENPYDYAMNVVTDNVLEYIIRPYVSNRDNEGTFSIRSHIGNVGTDIMTVRKEYGACYNYCVIGASSAYVPYTEITTYLTAKVFEKFRPLAKQLPVKADVDGFIKANLLDYDSIYRALTQNVPSIPARDLDWKRLHRQVNDLSGSDGLPPLLRGSQERIQAVADKLAENARDMLDMDPPPMAGEEQLLRSLPIRIREALRDLSRNAQYGPFYASHILRSDQSDDLLGTIRGYIDKNDKALQDERARLERLQTTRNKNLRNFKRKILFNIGLTGRAKKYYESELRCLRKQADIRKLQSMDKLLKDLQSRLETLHTGFFDKFEQVMANLQETFDANLEALSHPANDRRESYAVRLVSLQDEPVRRELDRFIDDMDVGTQVYDFVSYMLDHSRSWDTQEEDRISAAITDFFTEKLRRAQKNIEEFLKIKHSSLTPETLRQNILSEVQKLDQRADSLFWCETAYNISSAKSMGYLSIPSNFENIRAAAETFRNGMDYIRIRESYASDRITLYRFVSGVPLFGYQGVSTYRQNYVDQKIPGSHIYEGTGDDPRDNRMLMNIAPVSFLDQSEYTDYIRTALADYQKARELEIISKVPIADKTEYHLNLLDHAAVEKWAQEVREAVRTDAGKAEQLLSHEITLGTLPFVESIILTNDGPEDMADLVVRDHVLSSRRYMDLIREEIPLREKLRTVREELSAWDRTRQLRARGLQAFAAALAFGAVCPGGDTYTYTYASEFGRTVSLTSIDAQPPGWDAPIGANFPLYSAFLNFLILSDAEKNIIAETVKNNVRNPETFTAARDALQSTLNGEQLSKQFLAAKISYPDRYAEIRKFYDDLRVLIASYL